MNDMDHKTVGIVKDYLKRNSGRPFQTASI